MEELILLLQKLFPEKACKIFNKHQNYKQINHIQPVVRNRIYLSFDI